MGRVKESWCLWRVSKMGAETSAMTEPNLPFAERCLNLDATGIISNGFDWLRTEATHLAEYRADFLFHANHPLVPSSASTP